MPNYDWLSSNENQSTFNDSPFENPGLLAKGFYGSPGSPFSPVSQSMRVPGLYQSMTGPGLMGRTMPAVSPNLTAGPAAKGLGIDPLHDPDDNKDYTGLRGKVKLQSTFEGNPDASGNELANPHRLKLGVGGVNTFKNKGSLGVSAFGEIGKKYDYSGIHQSKAGLHVDYTQPFDKEKKNLGTLNGEVYGKNTKTLVSGGAIPEYTNGYSRGWSLGAEYARKIGETPNENAVYLRSGLSYGIDYAKKQKDFMDANIGLVGKGERMGFGVNVGRHWLPGEGGGTTYVNGNLSFPINFRGKNSYPNVK